MNLGTYLKTWRGTRAENMAQRPVLLVLVISNVILALLLFQQQRTVVMVPPMLTGEASISQGAASPEMQQEWGLFLTTLTGNMTPRSAEVVKESLSKHLAPSLYNRVIEWLDSEIQTISRDRVTLSFTPSVLRYEPSIDRVIVTGELVLRGMRGQERRQVRTYELGFRTSNYKVQLDAFEVYEGSYNQRGGQQE